MISLLNRNDAYVRCGPIQCGSVEDETVTVDFNHKLAGQTLQFSVEVVDVREPTAEELAHGHAHGPGASNIDECEN